MVTKAVAKKHKEDRAQAEYLRTLGRTPTYTGNPLPPITAEHVFGPRSPPLPAGTEDDMDTGDTALDPTLDELSPPSPDATFDRLPPHHPIPEDDFQPEINLDDDQYPPEPYNESLENLALEEELSDFANIKYGWLLVLNLFMLRCSLSITDGNIHEYDIESAKPFPGSSGLGYQRRCTQQSHKDFLALSVKTFPQLTSSGHAPRHLQELSPSDMTAVSTPTFAMLGTTNTWRNVQSVMNHALVGMTLMENPALDDNSSTSHLSHDYLPSFRALTWPS